MSTAHGLYDGPAAELSREYSPSSLVADLRAELAAYSERSEAARQALSWREIPYGARPCERLDFFPADVPNAPLVVFVHGGYWQQLDKRDASFPAVGLHARGTAYAALGYGLAPEHPLGVIVSMVRRGVRWLVSSAERLGCDPQRVVLAGSSAGAHLAASCLNVPLAGVALLSGVYDLEPLRHTYVNDVLGLTRAQARRLSPLLTLPRELPPTVVAVGEVETAEFTRQSREFAAEVASRGSLAAEIVAAGRNHFDICFDLVEDGTALNDAVAALIG
ncbi:alpha/beta hydrolase [Actinophytocola oryzae]|uniref:Arylformamidase n=1 Tax=Actinophytocola oryzae TaxID=502181 RepID=A0A4R7W5Y4_9PSEU|nr:alpha/beta hydrolase [Actinophytocola oryzae]TDV57409.1 arylformamidase [Actinophytocola oryzae]